jgi:hypothetical protein
MKVSRADTPKLPPNKKPYRGIMPGLKRGGRTQAGESGGDSIQAMVRAANQIDRADYPYKWGGGHNPSFSGPYDCSGAVSAVLHAGGALASPLTSGAMMGLGAPGEGPVTLYANPGHVFMSIGGRGFGTGSDNPAGGAGWLPYNSRPGFAVRHITGTGGDMEFLAGLGGAAGGMAAPRLKQRRVRNRGIPGRVGNAALGGARKAAQKRLDDAAGSASGGSAEGGAFTGGGNLRAWLTKALRITGHFSAANLAGLTRMAMAESGGNPNITQSSAVRDVNTAAGNPAKGLLQTIPQTFAAHKMPGHDNIFNPVDNAIASIRYQFSRYGRIVGHSGYALGGRLPMEFGGMFGDGGSFTTSKPMMIGVGERGQRERVTVERESAGNGMHGGGSNRPISVSIGHITYNGKGDIRKAIEEELAEVAKSLRNGPINGQSELD